VSKLQTLLPENQSLRGKVAVVVGGSRGLGAATALALALRGATVYAIYQHSEEQAKRLRTTAAGAPGEIMPVQGDAADAAWCQDLLAHINQRHEGLDILVCNACPSIQPLSFTPETLERVHRFVNESVAMVSVPMSVFLPALEKKAGWNILVSTEAVRTLPTPWPHYVTAKCAVEGLVQWAARQFKSTKFLVLRPPKLLTDQMNTPSGRQGATPVEVVAAAVVSRVAAATSGSLVEVMETFDGHEKGSNDKVTKT
jgi:NAD(P)-dependent dehydrogenase (short-subunit alcohol dehydrogenase family)